VLLGERSKLSRIRSHFEKEREVKRVIVHPKFHGVIVDGEFSKPIDYDIGIVNVFHFYVVKVLPSKIKSSLRNWHFGRLTQS